MKSLKFDNEQAWLDARLGRITGTRLKDIIIKRGTKQKKGFYEIIAERVALPANMENVMDRGKRLEIEAIEIFEKETGKVIIKDLVLWMRDENEDIAMSPDGFTKDLKSAVEVKCLNSASHIEAYLTKELPSEYEEQMLQYFIVNDELKTLYFVFYDPRMPLHNFFYLTIKRKDVEAKITEYLELEKQVLAQIAEIEKEFTF